MKLKLGSVFGNQLRVGDLVFHLNKMWLVEEVTLPKDSANRRYNYRASLVDPAEGKRIVKRGTFRIVAPNHTIVSTRK